MTCNINYDIVATGSKGNAVVVEKRILIDCGVPYKWLAHHVKGLQVVLLTHIHYDHFHRITIHRLAKERPTLRFACGEWLVKDLVDCGVAMKNIDVMASAANHYLYHGFTVSPVPLSHNVPNCGYKILFHDGRKMFYATDTNNLNGITAKDFNLYMVEANYGTEEIQERIAQKKENGEYAYEHQVLKNHLSKEKCDDFIYSNIGSRGTYVYLHVHEDKWKENHQ